MRSLAGLMVCCLALLQLSMMLSEAAAMEDKSSPACNFHFKPAEGVLGDVIPFYWDGVCHVYYLKGSSWGHITSRDLIHWQELPDALQKGADSDGPDGEACWTGSIIERQGIFHLFYTGKNSRDPLGDQKVMHATSLDLVVWSKHPEHAFYADGNLYWSKPVNGAIDDKQIYHHQAFRDPEVFWNPSAGKWSLLLHACLADGSSPATALYQSEDPVSWKPCQPMQVYPASVSGDCPHFFEMGGSRYLIAADRHYARADIKEERFGPEMIPYEQGELFVPKTLFDGKRRILFGWIGNREGSKDSGKGQWGGVMCMPREIYAGQDGKLYERPLEEVIGAFDKTVSRDVAPLLSEDGVDRLSDFMLHARLTAKSTAARADIHFRRPKDNPAGGYHLRLNWETGEAEISTGFQTYKAACGLKIDEPAEIRLFAEGTVIECFINEACCFTLRGYDCPEGSLSMRFEGAVEAAECAVNNLR